jgi:hypothetical protein
MNFIEWLWAVSQIPFLVIGGFILPLRYVYFFLTNKVFLTVRVEALSLRGYMWNLLSLALWKAQWGDEEVLENHKAWEVSSLERETETAGESCTLDSFKSCTVQWQKLLGGGRAFLNIEWLVQFCE